MKKKININTCSSTKGPFFLKIIDSILWLNSRGLVGHCSEVVVNYYPKRFENKFITLLEYAYGNKVRDIYKKIAESLKLKRLAGGNTDDSLARIRGDHVFKVKIDGINITFKKYYTVNYVLLLSAIWVALKTYVYAKFSTKCSVECLLLSQYNNIPVGMCAASSALRRYPRSGGDIKAIPLGLLWELIIATYMAKTYALSQLFGPSDFSIVPEKTYLDGILLHHALQSNSKVIDINNYGRVYSLITNVTDYYDSVYVDLDKNLNTKQIRRVEDYLSRRIENSSSEISYMTRVRDEVSGILDSHGHIVDVSPDSSVVILFLHGFQDAQYWYGFDGFLDIYDWTITTISYLSKNSNIDKILIKPHPNIDYESYPGDMQALRKIKKHIEGMHNVFLLDSRVSNFLLSRLNRVMAISHHGSVVEELCYNGVPCLVSEFGPWGSRYDFCLKWADKSEYLSLLSSYNLIEKSKSKVNISELIKYVYYYRLDAIDHLEREVWRDLLFCADIEPERRYWAAIRQCEEVVKSISFQSFSFEKFIKKRKLKHKSECCH